MGENKLSEQEIKDLFYYSDYSKIEKQDNIDHINDIVDDKIIDRIKKILFYIHREENILKLSDSSITKESLKENSRIKAKCDQLKRIIKLLTTKTIETNIKQDFGTEITNLKNGISENTNDCIRVYNKKTLEIVYGVWWEHIEKGVVWEPIRIGKETNSLKFDYEIDGKKYITETIKQWTPDLINKWKDALDQELRKRHK